jgi:hypothetical protein
MRTGLLAAAAFVSVSAGCYQVRPVWQPEAYLAHSKPEVVYLRLRNVPPIFVANPHLTGDTLRGTGPDGGSVAVAWGDVLDVYARQLHSTRTVFAVSGVTILSGLLVYSFAQNADGDAGPSLCELPAGSYDHDLDPECSRP